MNIMRLDYFYFPSIISPDFDIFILYSQYIYDMLKTYCPHKKAKVSSSWSIRNVYNKI